MLPTTSSVEVEPRAIVASLSASLTASNVDVEVNDITPKSNSSIVPTTSTVVNHSS